MNVKGPGVTISNTATRILHHSVVLQQAQNSRSAIG